MSVQGTVSREQQLEHLKRIRNGAPTDPHQTPEWNTTHWLFYLLYFPIEYGLILFVVLPVCILSFCVGIHENIKEWLWRRTEASPRFNATQNLKHYAKFNLTLNAQNATNKRDMLSVIIPCYNESHNIPPTLLFLDLYCRDRDNLEVIIVDGNSPDIEQLRGAVQATQPYLNLKPSQIRIIHEPHISGRGICQNVGVAHATGHYLLFLHADTILPPHYDHVIRTTLSDPTRSVLLGSFTFAVDRSLMRQPIVGVGWVEFFARFRNKLLNLPYGDQSLWMTRQSFIEIGGFKWIPILDDVELVFRCHAYAAKHDECNIYVHPLRAYCGPRRWAKNGVVRNTIRNQYVLFLYKKLNYTPCQLYEVYYGRKFEHDDID